MTAGAPRRRWVARDEGIVTAELAVALPAVALVLAVSVGMLQLAAVQVRLQDAAATGARAVARGDPLRAAASIAPGAELATWRDGALVCASASSHVRWLHGVAAVNVTASSCAVTEG